ncbi:MAG: NADH-quinone oxidoreductase subunit NuoK [Candidatus Wenzhouxiangella sp. M2_3B_020]
MSGLPIELPIGHVLAVAAVLFALGVTGVLIRRNVVFMLMSLEVVLNSAGLAFVAAGQHWGQPDGQVFFILILTLAAAEVSVGLALILQMFHRFRTLDMDAVREMRG